MNKIFLDYDDLQLVLDFLIGKGLVEGIHFEVERNE